MGQCAVCAGVPGAVTWTLGLAAWEELVGWGV